MRLDNPFNLFVEQVRDLYSAECQLMQAMPRAERRVNDLPLRTLLGSHLAETQEHAARLERIGQTMGFDCGGKRCLGMQGLLKETDEALGFGGAPSLVDAAIVNAARRIESYEIVMYEGLLALARQLDATDAAELLEQTLAEENQANEQLASIVE